VQYWSGLEVRLTEMNERRRKLIKYIFKKEGRIHQFEESFKSCLEQKKGIIKKFSPV
jgi:hypothetical protein